MFSVKVMYDEGHGEVVELLMSQEIAETIEELLREYVQDNWIGDLGYHYKRQLYALHKTLSHELGG